MNLGQVYRDSDRLAAVRLIERIDGLNEHRLAMTRAGNSRAAVVAADQIHGLLDVMTAEQLRAAVVQLTTPELRPALPVVVAAPAPAPAVDDVMRVVCAYGDVRSDYARRTVTSDAVQTALDGVRIAVEALAVGVLVREIVAEHRAGGL